MSIIYSSKMETLDFFTFTEFSSFLKAAWGIDGGNALTCSHSVTGRVIQPDYSTQLEQGTIRWQYAFLHSSGTLVNTLMLLTRCAYSHPVSYGAEFRAVIYFSPNGSVSLELQAAISGSPDFVTFTSAPGVFVPNGTYHAFQFRFSFSGHTTINYNVLVNDVSVISGTFIATATGTCVDVPLGVPRTRNHWLKLLNPANALCSDSSDQAGVNEFSLYHRQYAIDTMSSFVEVVIDDSNSPVSYLPGNAAQLTSMVCRGGVPDPPEPGDPPTPEEPIPPTLDISGIYQVVPTSTTSPGDRHDIYYNRIIMPVSSGLDRKILTPTIRTALFGD